jgi:hypothetical protein
MSDVRLTYANAHDAYDDAAYYIDGLYVGRESQINLRYDIYPRLVGKIFIYREHEIPLDPEDPFGDGFFWPESEADLL